MTHTNLKTLYMGLSLRSPIIVSSCGLTSSVENIKTYHDAGVGAVVLKSLFEEQINHESASLDDENNYSMGEASDYINAYVRENSVENYLKLIRDAKMVAQDMPIIASLNCLSGGSWIEFSKRIKEAGADALELNLFFMPTDVDQSSENIELEYLTTVSKVVEQVSIPVAVKMPRGFTNPLRMVRELYNRGVKGVVMFNRFYEPDIDIENLSIGTSEVLSNHTEMRGTLRLLAQSKVAVSNIDLGASTGIESGEAVVKCMLAGAKVVEISSAVYKAGDTIIKYMNDFVDDWMKKHSYKNTEDVVGRLANTTHDSAWQRAQFMKYFSNKGA